ncbi:MAG TPA: hypothetical protein VHZ49_07485 [Methylomirabilota bacterium]|jgi:hypothetical protein|nr:hypothetical protein [Methylomirabilota bacterium]
MAEAGASSRCCAVCGRALEGSEALIGIPDLMIEMHETCYRRSQETKKPTPPKVPE